jgi:hypothetical protein
MCSTGLFDGPVALVSSLLAFGGGSDASLEAVQAGLGQAVVSLLTRWAAEGRRGMGAWGLASGPRRWCSIRQCSARGTSHPYSRTAVQGVAGGSPHLQSPNVPVPPPQPQGGAPAGAVAHRRAVPPGRAASPGGPGLPGPRPRGRPGHGSAAGAAVAADGGAPDRARHVAGGRGRGAPRRGAAGGDGGGAAAGAADVTDGWGSASRACSRRRLPQLPPACVR